MTGKIETLHKDIFWTRCVVGLLFLFLAGMSMANWNRHPAIVRANEFLLTDRAGNVVARLGQYGYGDTCLTLTAKAHVSVANLCVQDDEGSSLDLHNLKAESRATLTPGFNVYEPLFHFRPALVISEAKNPHSVDINLGAEKTQAPD
jgi:hypothetical protein